MEESVKHYIQLMRLDRPIGILLLLWPTVSALWIAAEGIPDPLILIVFVLGVIIMRSAGCVINDFADRHVDGYVTRTQNRPLATGVLASKEALSLFAILGVSAFLLVLLLNTLTILMSFVALFLAMLYPFMKRYTYFPQLFLGAAFGWAIPMAFAAQTGSVPAVAWLLFFANILWTTAYDTFYAMADREDDLVVGIKSTAILFGDDDRLIIGILQFSFLVVMILVGQQLEMSLIYYAGIMTALGLSIYQQQLVKERRPEQCIQAFLNNNWLGMAIFVAIAAHYAVV